MRRDYEDVFDLGDLDDGEIAQLIRQQLEEYPELDPDLLRIDVSDGFVTLSGRVGTEQELQTLEHVITAVLGIPKYSNEVVVDELVRGEYSEAADEAAAQDNEVAGQLGKGAVLAEDSASHLLEDLESELYGTHDVNQAIERGYTYEPPDRPLQEGSWSEETH
ncbi:MAG: BON domain-containing protein [Gemmatimonadetes bacterium]|nr:BON domain-containing protein [Gemmatimonadota bacterium]